MKQHPTGWDWMATFVKHQKWYWPWGEKARYLGLQGAGRNLTLLDVHSKNVESVFANEKVEFTVINDYPCCSVGNTMERRNEDVVPSSNLYRWWRLRPA